MSLTVTDMFCGAGGSSIGAEAVPGLQLRMAANHWRLAVESHNSNFSHADHDCADISAVRPQRWPTTDILLASPECTNHTTAKNHNQAAAELTLWDPKEDAERSRATMWDVPRFAEFHRYRVVVIENVVEARSWSMFDAWVAAMHAIGYRHQVVYLNSQFAPSDAELGLEWDENGMSRPPQSRDRMYVVFTRLVDPEPDLDLRPPADCPGCGQVEARQVFKSRFEDALAAATRRRGGVRPDRIRWGLYKSQYDYRCPTCDTTVEPFAVGAWAAIDWRIHGERIGGRATPLAEKTMERIRRGLVKYGNRPALVQLGYPADDSRTSTSTDAAFPSQTGRQDIGLVHPLLVQIAGHTFEREGSTCRTRTVDVPMKTQTGTQDQALVLAPFIAELRGGGSHARHVADPLATVEAGGNHHMLVHGGSFIVKNYGAPGGAADWMLQTPAQPLGAVTTQDHHGLVQAPAEWSYAFRQDADVDDCFYRMLEPAEIGAAMAFRRNYVVLGNKRNQVRQYGNAVTPPAMRFLLTRIVGSVFGQDVAA